MTQGKKKKVLPRLLRYAYILNNVSNYSAVQILYEIVEAYHARDVKVFFVRLRDSPMVLFRKSGLLKLVGEENLFRRVPDAIETIERDMINNGIYVEQ